MHLAHSIVLKCLIKSSTSSVQSKSFTLPGCSQSFYACVYNLHYRKLSQVDLFMRWTEIHAVIANGFSRNVDRVKWGRWIVEKASKQFFAAPSREHLPTFFYIYTIRNPEIRLYYNSAHANTFHVHPSQDSWKINSERSTTMYITFLASCQIFWENVCTLCGPMLTTSVKIGGKKGAKLNCKLCQFNLTCRCRIVMHYNSLQLIKYTRSCQQGHNSHLLCVAPSRTTPRRVPHVPSCWIRHSVVFN